MICQTDIDQAYDDLKYCELDYVSDILTELWRQYNFREQDAKDLYELMAMVNAPSIYRLKEQVKELQCCANILTEKCKDYEQEIKDWQEGYELRFKDLCKVEKALDKACEWLYGDDCTVSRTKEEWKEYLLQESEKQ